MQKYKEDISSKGRDGSYLDAVISILQHSSKLVEIFNDKQPISSVTDRRLAHLNSFHKFVLRWREESTDNNSNFLSSKLFFDLQSMFLGFMALVAYKLRKFPQSVIKPAIVNQDCAENHFCQVRASNGQNNNPTFRQQESTQNSIRYGQTTISRKSNAGLLSKKKKQLTSCSLPTATDHKANCTSKIKKKR